MKRREGRLINERHLRSGSARGTAIFRADQLFLDNERYPLPTKPFYLSTGFWGVVLMFIALLIGRFGYKVDESLQGETAESIVGLIGVVVSLIGRWRATRPLSLTGGVVLPPKSKIYGIGLLAMLMLSAAGCASNATPLQKVFTARQTYTAILNTISPIMESGVTSQKTNDLLYAIRLEVSAGLNDAEDRAIRKDVLGFEFVMARVNGALDKLLRIFAVEKKKLGPRAGVEWRGMKRIAAGVG